MEKKFYLKPELEILLLETESMIAATGTSSHGDGSDDYIIDTSGKEPVDPDDLG